MYDANGAETTNATASVKNVYRMQVRKLLGSLSSSKILVARTSTLSTVTALGPSDVQVSSKPLGGRFRIKCVSKGGVESYTQPMTYTNWWNSINQRIMEDCN